MHALLIIQLRTKSPRVPGRGIFQRRRTSTQYPLHWCTDRTVGIWIKNSPRSFKTGFVLRCMCSECIDDIVAFKSVVSVRPWMLLATNLLEYYNVLFVWLTRHVHWFSFTFPALHRWHPLATADGSKGSRSHNKHPKLAQRSSTGHPH